MSGDDFRKRQERMDKAWAEFVAERAAALQKEEMPMMKEIDISYRTMFAELVQRTHDGQFLADFPLEGWFATVTVKGRDYWYFDLPTPEGKDKRSYVGPHSDEAITARVKAHKEIKDTLKSGGAWSARCAALASPVLTHSRATSRKPSLTPDCSSCGPFSSDRWHSAHMPG
jgi:hypothetical protein